MAVIETVEKSSDQAGPKTQRVDRRRWIASDDKGMQYHPSWEWEPHALKTTKRIAGRGSWSTEHLALGLSRITPDTKGNRYFVRAGTGQAGKNGTFSNFKWTWNAVAPPYRWIRAEQSCMSSWARSIVWACARILCLSVLVLGLLVYLLFWCFLSPFHFATSSLNDL